MTLFASIKKNSKLFFVIWCFLLVIASSIPYIPTPKIKALDSTIRLDYLIHFLEYFILSLFFMFWQMDKEDNNSKIKFKKILFYIVLGMSFALLDEMYQKLIPGRKFNIIDFMYDSLGFSIGIFSMFLITLVKDRAGLTAKKV